jgi:Na+-driven multidrug efflux pump
MWRVVLGGGAGFVPVLRVRLQWPLFKQILDVGAVACLMAALSNLTTILVTAQLRHFGVVAVAAYGISARLEFMMIPLSFGIGSALTALVGRSVGAGDWASARRIAWIGGIMSFGVTGVVGLLVSLSPLAFVSLFTPDTEVAGIAALAVTYIGPAFGGFGLGMAMYFAAMGAHRMRWPLYAALARIVLAVGLGGLLADYFGMGMVGHFWGVALGITAYGVFAAVSVRAGVWR